MNKILIIDDDDIFRKMLHQLLERSGYQVFDAEDGRKGTALFRQLSPDLVITDIVMPEQEGIGTIREIRESDPNIPIIAISGGGRLSADSYLPMAKAMGAHVTFAKPFNNNELLNAVASLIQPSS